MGLSSPTSTSNISAPVACLNCRDKHLRCDGNQTGCARCIELNLFCHFVPSRRGRKTRAVPYPLPVLNDLPGSLDESASQECHFVPSVGPTVAVEETTSSARIGSATGSNQYLRLYYRHFHLAHPFLLPRDAFMQSSPPDHLLRAVELVSWHYLQAAGVANGPVVEQASGLQTTIKGADSSLEKVQACLLLTFILHANGRPLEAKDCTALAVHCSLELGLHRPDFAEVLDMLNPLQAESARRTWWELFTLDTLLAAVQVHGALQFTLETPAVPLPCDDEEYNQGRAQVGTTLQELAHRALLHENSYHSASASRVEAASILRQCLLASSQDNSQEHIDVLDTVIVGWFHRLEGNQHPLLHYSGEVDELAFQARMIMHCAFLYLHFPQSYLLAFLPTSSAIFCARPPNFACPSSFPQVHTAKVLQAANGLSKLAAVSPSTISHSPFFACALVMSSSIQLAILAIEPESASSTWHYLSLNMGVLKSMASTWPIAAVSTERIRSIAREVSSALAAGAAWPGQEVV
ncbi:beta-glucosidase precursor [Penicillium chrysogenum]|jgi:hypothetical protein|nr:beta-glucosidase precursor [Penicillium chrysogenum]